MNSITIVKNYKIFKHIHFQFNQTSSFFATLFFLIIGLLFYVFGENEGIYFMVLLLTLSSFFAISLIVQLIKSYSLYKYFIEISLRKIYLNNNKNYVLKGNAYVWWGNSANNPAKNSILGTHIIYYYPYLKHYFDFKKLDSFYSPRENLDFLKTYWDEKKKLFKIEQEIVSNEKYELIKYLPINKNYISNINRSWTFKFINFFKYWFFIKEDIVVLSKQDSDEITLLFESEFRVLFDLA